MPSITSAHTHTQAIDDTKAIEPSSPGARGRGHSPELGATSEYSAGAARPLPLPFRLQVDLLRVGRPLLVLASLLSLGHAATASATAAASAAAVPAAFPPPFEASRLESMLGRRCSFPSCIDGTNLGAAWVRVRVRVRVRAKG